MFSFKHVIRTTTLIVSLCCANISSASDIIVGTWNTKRMGHGEKQDFHALSEVASKFDLLALQEVMNESGLQRLVTALEYHTGESWSTLISHAIGSSSYKEHYAFIWKDSSVEYLEGAAVYVDYNDKFSREPFSAKFRSKHDNSELALGTVHIIYGKGVSDRTPEIIALSEYWGWLSEIYPSTPLMLVGDFNLNPTHPAWRSLTKSARPLILEGASTLSSINGKYANLYDNIWVESDTNLAISSYGILDFPRLLNLSHDKSRAHVSDHAPIYVALGEAKWDGALNTIQESRENSTYTSSGPVIGNKKSNIYHFPHCL